MNKNEENANVRILCFETHNQLAYWYRKILIVLRKAYPELIWKIKAYKQIDFGTQRWIFTTEYHLKYERIGYRNVPRYHYAHLTLEENFKDSLIKILKGE